MATNMATPYPHGTAAFAQPSNKKLHVFPRKTARGLGNLDMNKSTLGLKWRFLRDSDAADVARLADFAHDYAPQSTSEAAYDGQDAADLLQALQEQQNRIAESGRHNATHARVQRKSEAAKPAPAVTFAMRRPHQVDLYGNDSEESDSESDDDSEGPKERSASPVILWRTSARVKVANDIPSELRSVFIAAGSSPGARRDAAAPAVTEVVPKPPRPGSRRALEAAKQAAAQKQREMCARRQQYGSKWFMPAESWHVALDADDESLNAAASAPGALASGAAEAIRKTRAAAAELERKLDDTRSQLGALDISRAYKQFIMEQKGGPGLPHYLKHVEVRHDAEQSK
jgi:hypothetical protein